MAGDSGKFLLSPVLLFIEQTPQAAKHGSMILTGGILVQVLKRECPKRAVKSETRTEKSFVVSAGLTCRFGRVRPLPTGELPRFGRRWTRVNAEH